MELLLRTNFDIPKPPGGVFDPLRYLSLGSGQQQPNPHQQIHHHHQQQQQQSVDPIKVEQHTETKSTSPTAVYEVARPILQGCHAIPTKLKILLDRVLSSLSQEEVLMIVSGCGWQLDDYQRGYKLKDPSGSPLDRWHMCKRHEEHQILKQFLLFRETRTITQQLMIQDLAERSISSGQTDNANKEKEYKKEKEEENRTERKDSLLQMVTDYQRPKYQEKEVTSSPPPKRESITESPPPSSSKPSSLSSVPTSVPTTASPMFPHSGMGSGIPLPPSSMPMSSLLTPPMPFPGMFPFGPHMKAQHQAAQQPSSISQTKDGQSGREFNGGQALNLTRPEKSHNLAETRDLEVHHDIESDSGSRRSSLDTDIGKRHQNLPDDLGISYVSPTTGKKRVQCNVCMKTFCDKGALKIHFSAVHLREMHKCSINGCNMMFSSRRSRNRHSANPNPKLHTPQVKRRISQHDGRTHPGPITPTLIPKETSKERESIASVPKEREPGFPGGHVPGGGFPNPTPGMPPLGFPGLPGFNPFLPPDLKTLQQDLQRFSDLQKLYGGSGLGGSIDSSNQQTFSNSSCQKYSDSETSSDHQRNYSDNGTDGGNRKRKSQNPTKRPHLEMDEADEHISSDSASDEGFPDPMMEDDDDDLGDVSSGDEDAA